VLELGRWAWPRGCHAPHQSRPEARGHSSLGVGVRVGAQGHSPASPLGVGVRAAHCSGSGLRAAHRLGRGSGPLAARGLALASASGGG
jgi:hypothetical protein